MSLRNYDSCFFILFRAHLDILTKIEMVGTILFQFFVIEHDYNTTSSKYFSLYYRAFSLLFESGNTIALYF